MEALIRFWRFIVRIALGLIFLVLIVLHCKIQLWNLVAEQGLQGVVAAVVNSKPDTTLALMVLAVAAIGGAVGLQLLEIAVVAFEKFVSVLYRCLQGKAILAGWLPQSMCAPLPALAYSYYLMNKRSLLEMSDLRSRSATLLEDDTIHQTMVTRLEVHMDKISDSSLIEEGSYYASLTQEQAKRASMREEIKEVHYYATVVFLAAVLFSRSSGAVIGWTTLVIFTAGMLSVALVERRRRYAKFILMGYLDLFTIAPSATVEDRDAPQ
jgi:hypothetical protein